MTNTKGRIRVTSQDAPAGLARVEATWLPYIGPGYCLAYAPVRRSLLRAGGIFAGTYILGILSVFALKGSVFQIPTLIVLFGVGLATLWVSMRRQERFGIQIAQDLREEGFPADRPAPMRNVYLFGKWQARNNIPTDVIVGTGNSRHLA